MLKAKAFQQLKNQRGLAALELIPILVIFVLFVNYSFGFFGTIHTGILNSMAARNYSFETFTHRPDLTYFRDASGSNTLFYTKVNFRVHATVSEKAGANNQTYMASERHIDFIANKEPVGENSQVHNQLIYTLQDSQRFTAQDGANPVWVRPQYGICLNSTCGQPN